MAELRTILFVEDDPDIQVVARLALEAVGGYVVEPYGSGAAALSAAEQAAPDLIVLDVMMPGMDGPATLAALRELPSLARTPVIFMTARAQHQEVADYLALGAAGVITKPFDPLTLSATVAAIWQEARADTGPEPAESLGARSEGQP